MPIYQRVFMCTYFRTNTMRLNLFGRTHLSQELLNTKLIFNVHLDDIFLLIFSPNINHSIKGNKKFISRSL